MSAVRTGRNANLSVGPTARRRLTWLTAALVTGWMTATIICVLAVFTGISPETQATVVTAVGTAVLTVLLYGRFQRIGRVDEPLVLCLLVCWATTLGLLSL